MSLSDELALRISNCRESAISSSVKPGGPWLDTYQRERTPHFTFTAVINGGMYGSNERGLP